MIGWTNVVVGILALLLQLVIFREKSRCKMTGWPTNIKQHCLNFKLHNVRQIHWFGLLVSYGTTILWYSRGVARILVWGVRAFKQTLSLQLRYY